MQSPFTSGAKRHARERQFSDRSRRQRGFTLLETALAIVIVASGVLAIMYAQQALHQQNRWANLSSTGTFLANEIREMVHDLPRHDPVTGPEYWGPEPEETILDDFDDLDDFDGSGGLGVEFTAEDSSGPVNAMRSVIPNMDGWSQTVIVYNVDPQDVSADGDPLLDATTSVMRVEVVVSYQAPNETEPSEITRVAWLSSN